MIAQSCPKDLLRVSRLTAEEPIREHPGCEQVVDLRCDRTSTGIPKGGR
jgi:hypothetical protein